MLWSEYDYDVPYHGVDVAASFDAEDMPSAMAGSSQPTTSLYHAALQSAENYHKPLVKLVSVSSAATERLHELFEEHGREIAAVLRAEFGSGLEPSNSDIISLPRVQGDSKSRSNKRIAGAHEAGGSKVLWCAVMFVSKCNAYIHVFRRSPSSHPSAHVFGPFGFIGLL